MSTAGNLARVMLVLGSFIRALGMGGTSGAGLKSGGFCWAPAGRSAIVRAATAIHNARRGSHRNIVTPPYAILVRHWPVGVHPPEMVAPSNYTLGGGISAPAAASIASIRFRIEKCPHAQIGRAHV